MPPAGTGCTSRCRDLGSRSVFTRGQYREVSFREWSRTRNGQYVGGALSLTSAAGFAAVALLGGARLFIACAALSAIGGIASVIQARRTVRT